MPSSLGPDFRRLWTANAVSALGSGIGSGALPLVAVLALDASTFQVALLAALSALAGAAIALPTGSFIEQRHKRPVMIAADLTRFVALASVPVAAAFDLLTYVQLCVVGVLQAGALIVFNSASGAHLKALVPADGRSEANSRFEATYWTSLSVGPPIGGALVGLVGATVTLGVDAVSFLLSAIGIGRIRRPEPVPERLPTRPNLGSGWKYILEHRGLRALFWNSQLFGGPVMMTSPLLAVLMLRDLGMKPWQYGVALGVPCLGGVIGARLAPPLTRRFGLHRMLIVFGVLRTPWLLLLPLATPGTGGLVLIVLVETGLLIAAGAFNPSFTTYRMEATEDGFMARVQTSWAITSRTVQPAFMAAGGVLAGLTSLRATLVVAGALCLVSAFVLPWKSAEPAPLPLPA
ncbi:putative MFS family arabinose efflux permease [Kribbella voronezhensis]|uniref:Putative MFS family arabinose efflux permease n=1 Tax=Kribbella voronezhensis TaxID=2512212 RepID=A0A4R7TCV5_9ACTN|nr:MFS transporter [Kribbella voronezhensis]TDU89951.1 putative MFS family arabinose efflux permease [Kribbella voronezhensis]